VWVAPGGGVFDRCGLTRVAGAAIVGAPAVYDDCDVGTEAARVEGVLVAFADPTRRRILDVLATEGVGTATTIAAELPVTRQAVVKHLGVLDQAGLVTCYRAGREVRYLVRPDALEATARWMSEIATYWASRRSADGTTGDPAAGTA
jgi:DNA-binding transcriptional ArsR family regulator